MSKTTASTERPPQLNIKVSEEEKEMAEKVAKARGLNTSGLVRLLLWDEARRLGIK
jgi:antitoxin component of RelBE/YafQ-DinJ toxin-antitoxin module